MPETHLGSFFQPMKSVFTICAGKKIDFRGRQSFCGGQNIVEMPNVTIVLLFRMMEESLSRRENEFCAVDRHARHVESSCTAMWERARHGEKPVGIDLG